MPMNERKFLKQINSKLNKDGNFTCLAVNDLLQEEKKMLISNQKIGIQRIFSKVRKVKSAEEIIADNFETILNKTDGQHIALLYKFLTNDESTTQVVLNNFNRILDRVNSSDVSTFDTFIIFLNFREKETIREFIVANRDEIIPKISPEKVFEVARSLKEISEEFDCKLDEALENHKLDVARYILESSMICEATAYKPIDKEFLDQYSGKLLSLIDTTLQDEQVRMIDIESGEPGSFTKTFQIGEKILKIGAPREVLEIPRHSHILEPIKEMKFTSSNDDLITHIELTRRAELLSSDDRREDDLYQLYKMLRNDGIIWTDTKFENVGKIDGKLMIIDRDFIYKEGNPNIIWHDNTYAKSFEKRYLQEKTNNQVQEFKNKIKIQQPSKDIEQRSE